MRAILILVVICLLMVMAGWLTFGRNGSQTTISLETKKMERDAENAVNKGKSLLQNSDRGAPAVQQPIGQ